MACYSIIWQNRAAKELRNLPHEVIPQVVAAINNLAESPYPDGVKKLAGRDNHYRIRQGRYRVIYTIENQQLIIEIIRVAHRKEVYRNI
ncbi:MAG: type II toxin-antitoxin system RelE/ParE family toxin [Gammaproteobacteria bacterium]|nr:type II toxin-antitoxin system RelE/ParE family toxin [Gammaproteobacteria bacterium]